MRAPLFLPLCFLVVACAKGPSTAPQQSLKAPEVSKASEAEVDNDAEGELIKAPPAGSPEAVIQQLLMAAMNPDEAAGWKTTSGLLHSSMSAQKAQKSYREMNYPASRRKVALFTPDDSKAHFRVTRKTSPSDDKVKLFIHNEKSMPTPCTLKRDPAAEGAWRVYVCSL